MDQGQNMLHLILAEACELESALNEALGQERWTQASGGTGKVLSFMDERERDRSKDRVQEAFERHRAGVDTEGRRAGQCLHLKSAMEELHVGCEDVEAMLDEMDKNKDGKVDFEEFYASVTKARGVECWARKLGVWRSLGDGLVFYVGGAKDPLRRIGELKAEEISCLCEAVSAKMKRELTQAVAEVKESFAAMDEKAAREEAEQGHAKFQTFKASMGSIEDFRKGLGSRVGHPNPKLWTAMEMEHVHKDGCDTKFKTRNYGIETTPRQEWRNVIVDASECREEDRQHGRRVRLLEAVLEDEEVAEIVEAATLIKAEVASTVMYTGPMYEVYNSCLRQQGGDELYARLSESKNLFATTIFLLASAVQKISQVMKLGEGLKVYRGLGGQMELPEKMVLEDKYGRRGAAEWGFMSTTTNKSIAVMYSGVREGKPLPSVLVAEVSAIDRGACIKAFSQYPQEIEYLYPPLSFIELSGEEYFEVTGDGPVRMIPVRISVNQKTMTSDEVVGQKKELHLRAFEYLMEEARRDLMGKEEAFGPRFQRDPLSSDPEYEGYKWLTFVDGILEECGEVLDRHKLKVEAEEYNNEEQYEGLVREMLLTKRMAISKARLYLEDDTVFLASVVDRYDMRSCHRLWMARLRRMASGDGDEDRRREAALELCKAKGLVVRSVEEENESGEGRMLEAGSDGWRAEDVELLCAIGGDVNLRGHQGLTPVMEAARYGHLGTLVALIERKADVNGSGGNGFTVLMAASEEGHVDVLEVLLERGADVNACDEGGGGLTALAFASMTKHVEAVKLLLANGANVNSFHETGAATALMAAAMGGSTIVVQVLLENGADVNLVSENGSALMFAAQSGHVEVVKQLLENGADVNLVAKNPGSALIIAAQCGHVEVVKLLLENGADVNLVSEHGSALMLAAGDGHVEVVKQLLENGADVNIKNRNGKTARDYAVKKGHHDVIALLG